MKQTGSHSGHDMGVSCSGSVSGLECNLCSPPQSSFVDIKISDSLKECSEESSIHTPAQGGRVRRGTALLLKYPHFLSADPIESSIYFPEFNPYADILNRHMGDGFSPYMSFALANSWTFYNYLTCSWMRLTTSAFLVGKTSVISRDDGQETEGGRGSGNHHAHGHISSHLS